MSQVLVEFSRGGRTESEHHGTVMVADGSGAIRASAGDPGTFAYFRSSAKPFQAVPMVESGAADRFGFTPAELALCCASHSAEPFHQAQVLAMLAKLGLDPGALQCGIVLPADDDAAAAVLTGATPSSPLQCDCSGKHTGMLAACLQLGFPIENYLDPSHPLQVIIRGVVARVCRQAPHDLQLATDGCSVPTFGTSIANMAVAFATLAAPQAATPGGGGQHAAALDRLRSAMIAHPENVGGTKGRLDTDMMRYSGGKLVAKGGAEGLMCVGVPEHGVGIAVRIADGTSRGHPVVIAAVLEELDLLDGAAIDAIMAHHDTRILNHNRIHVGDKKAVFDLKVAAGAPA